MVTFTRDAAEELESRLKKALDPASFQRCVVGTFHSLAIAQLRDGKLVDPKKIATPAMQQQFLFQAVNAWNRAQGEGEGVELEQAMKDLERAKYVMAQPQEWEGFLQVYHDILARNGLVDLYDVIRMAWVAVRDDKIPPIGVNGEICTHLMVDEFQDTDILQYCWLIEHVRRGVFAIAVGDDDQTLYEWRQAMGYEGMMRFKQDTGASEFLLVENYRSKSEILVYADNLIRWNKGARVQKSMSPMCGDGGHVEFMTGSNREQMHFLVEQILKDCQKTSEGSRYQWSLRDDCDRSWAIIARNHRTLHLAEMVLTHNGIEYTRIAGSVLKQDAVTAFHLFLKSLQTGDPAGIDAMLGMLGVTHQGIGDIHRILGKSFFRLLDEVDSIGKLGNDKDSDIVKKLQGLCVGWRNALRTGNYSIVIHGVCSHLCSDGLKGAWNSDKRDWVHDAAEFLDSPGRWTIRTKNGSRPASLSERVEYIYSLGRDKSKAGVQLHTMHSAKGLEFNSVGLFNITQGIIPTKDHPDDVNDRRLLFVSMTRAKENLFVTSRTGEKSKFLNEL